MPAHQTGNVRLFDAQYPASLRLRKSSILDEPIDLQREAGLEPLTLGVGKAEVGKDGAATLFDLDCAVLLHLTLHYDGVDGSSGSCSQARKARASSPVAFRNSAGVETVARRPASSNAMR